MKYIFSIISVFILLYSCNTSISPENKDSINYVNKISEVDSVGIQSFEAIHYAADTVLLIWETEFEIDNFGFEIQVSSDGINFYSIGFVEGQGTIYNYSYYEFKFFIDNLLGKYFRLKILSIDSSFTFSQIVTIAGGIEDENPVVPQTFQLHQNYPNPFNGMTSIEYQLPTKVFVTLTVYDVFYNPVETLAQEDNAAGNHKYIFDARGYEAGLYFYELKTDNFKDIKAMFLMPRY